MRSFAPIALLALLIACSRGGGAPAPVAAASVVRGPQIAQVEARSALVAWRTDAPVIGAIECTSGLRLVDAEPTREHVFPISGLDADTAYEYSIVNDGAPSGNVHRFRTAPGIGTGAVRFAVIGDSGSGDDAQLAVAASMARSLPDLVLIAGDVVYETGTASELDAAYFQPYRSLLGSVPFYLALGNHDVMSDNGSPLLGSVHMPRNDADGSDRFYSFDRGPVHFVALDSTQELAPGSVQGDWLDGDLAANALPWTVVFLHHPPYSSSLHGSSLDVRAALAPVCDRHGVDVVFAGHDHVYERTHPLANDAVAAGEPGTIYVVTGGGGRGLYTAGTSWFTAASIAAHHHIVVEVAENSLVLRAIDRDDTVLDAFSITRSR